MSYSAWSVVFGEQPSAAKWNILGTNDSSFNDGTGIGNLALSTTALSNPYKFSAYASGTTSAGAGVFTLVAFATEEYDTNNNFASSTYTAPVNGFYQFNAALSITAGGAELYIISLYKNGSEFKRGNGITVGGAGAASLVVAPPPFQLNATDTITVEVFNNSGGAKTVGTGQNLTYFGGFLVSKT